MALEGSLELTGLEFPDFDGAVFGGRGDLGVLGVEGKTGDVALVPFQFEFGWTLRQIQLFTVGLFGSFSCWALRQLFL